MTTEKMTGTSTATGASPTTAASPTQNRDDAAFALKTSVTREAHDLTGEVKHLAGDLATEMKKKAESRGLQGKTRAVEGLQSVAHAIRKTGEQLRAEDDGAFTDYFDRAARQIDSASSYLGRRSFGQLVGDVEQFARREPALFLGGAFVAGILGGRFLKSSRPSPETSSHGQGDRREGDYRQRMTSTGRIPDRSAEFDGGAKRGGPPAARHASASGASQTGAEYTSASAENHNQRSGSGQKPKGAGDGTRKAPGAA